MTETPPSAQLLPCPHCNGKALTQERRVKMDCPDMPVETLYKIVCGNCLAWTFRTTEEEAAKFWNTRQPDPLLAEAMDALREVTDDLKSEIDGRVGGLQDKYPSEMRRYQRDILPVTKARAILSKYNGGK